MKVSELGEIALLRDIILKSVSQAENDTGDDCAHIVIADREVLWSIDPCPTPAARWFGLDSPEVYGWYTALINLSDVAACGGTPLGMLVSLEFPDDTTVRFVEGFQRGLRRALDQYDAKLFGGNVKSAPKFAATGSIIGVAGSAHSLRRMSDDQDASVYLVGPVGHFWTSIVAHHMNDIAALSRHGDDFRKALCYPDPQVRAGQSISSLPYRVSCMDCSDGVLNALCQLATASNVDIMLNEHPEQAIPEEFRAVLLRHGFNPANALFQFGDWQLLCLVPQQRSINFEEKMTGYRLTHLGETCAGSGRVFDSHGRVANRAALNENFSGGYNSITTLNDLLEKFMRSEPFIG